MYALGVFPGHAQLLRELTSAITHDQAYIDWLGRAAPSAPADAARSKAFKLDYGPRVRIALPPLTEHTGDSAAGRTRLQARYVPSLGLQRLESSIDGYLTRGPSASSGTWWTSSRPGSQPHRKGGCRRRTRPPHTRRLALALVSSPWGVPAAKGPGP